MNVSDIETSLEDLFRVKMCLADGDSMVAIGIIYCRCHLIKGAAKNII